MSMEICNRLFGRHSSYAVPMDVTKFITELEQASPEDITERSVTFRMFSKNGSEIITKQDFYKVAKVSIRMYLFTFILH